uniref:AAA domain-containing protein, putative AbiEii toxin, Type IV TA system n=1 Tax=Candidatus Kentrum sp. TUN TaxID=2126343 RepID=A0A451A9C8_9GAMM|nr:MAG: AAA domain-containing protein, putative AbiEii toxin, Type IV TA system [Candidatus Kentron sp. TUN]
MDYRKVSSKLADLKNKQIISIKILHAGEGGETVTFDLGEESDGTRRLFSFAGPWIDSLANGRVLFIDELRFIRLKRTWSDEEP